MTIGIDYGTSNTVGAVYSPSGPKRIRTLNGHEAVPSVVAVQRDGRVLVGHHALAQMDDNPEFTFRHVKRWLGVDFNEQEHGSYQMTEGPDGKVWWRGPDRDWSGPELAAKVIESVLRYAEMQSGVRPTKAVLTHPAGWHQPQEDALMEAGRLAGLQGVTLLSEPVAAALAFGVERHAFSRILVYDFGGGTFDVTVMNSRNGTFKVVGSNGLNDVGGIDFDKRIENAVVEAFRAKHGEDLRTTPRAMSILSRKAETAKKTLSETDDASIYESQILTVDGKGFLPLEYPLTLAEFNALTSDLTMKTFAKVRDALREANLHIEEIRHVLPIGGMTRVRAIREGLAEIFGKEKIQHDCEPEEAVAFGAAIYAAEQDGVIERTILAHTCPASIGVLRENGVMVPLIRKGAKLPATSRRELTNAADGAQALSLVVLQGENTLGILNTTIFRHHEPVDPEDAGSHTLPISVSMGEDRAITVMVRDEIIWKSGEVS